VFASTTTTLTIDKSELDMVTDATATGKAIRIFIATVSKNEQGANFLRRFIQLEQTLGAPDDAQPAQIQSHYIPGAVATEYQLDVPTEGMITSSVTFSGKTYETRTGALGVKSGTRPDLPQVDGVNTGSDIKRWRIAF
jgi:hypothetical protein